VISLYSYAGPLRGGHDADVATPGLDGLYVYHTRLTCVQPESDQYLTEDIHKRWSGVIDFL